MSQVATNDGTNKWYYDVGQTSRSAQPCYGRARSFLYEALYRSITQHNLRDSYRILRLLPRDSSSDPYILFRFVLIMIQSVDTKLVNKNLVMHIESLLSHLDITKPDAFVEYLTYFIRNDRLEDAQELFIQRQKFMHSRIHRQLPYVDVNLSCYEFLFNYTTWEKQANRKFDVSMQGWIVNAIERLKSNSGNYEYFVMCIVRVLLCYGFRKKAYLFVSEFQRNNPDNLSAQLLLLKLIDKLITESVLDGEAEEKKPILDEDTCNQNRTDELRQINNFTSEETVELFEFKKFPIKSDKSAISANLRCLDPRREEVRELIEAGGDRIENLRYMMDSLEFINGLRDSSLWRCLHANLLEILSSDDENLISELRLLWRSRYQKLWSTIDFTTLVGRKSKRKEVVKEVLSLLSHLSCSEADSHLDDLMEVDDESFSEEISNFN